VSQLANKIYAKRINQVIDYIYEHLEDDLSVACLSKVANFSKFHFHRQFSNYTGITVFKLVQLIRLRKSAYQLLFNEQDSILMIALTAKFESAEAFSRAFKKAFSQTPSQFRKQPFQQPWLIKFQIPPYQGKHNMNVTLVEFKDTKVAALEHRKSPKKVDKTINEFIQWRKQNSYSPNNSKTYGVIYDDPDNVLPEDFRFDLCGEISRPVEINSYGVVEKVIPRGRCAVLRHLGSLENIGDTVRYLYSKWLPDSGEALRDFPCFFHYVKLASEVPENEQITDIYLPLI